LLSTAGAGILETEWCALTGALVQPGFGTRTRAGQGIATERAVSETKSSEGATTGFEVVYTANGEVEAQGIKCALEAAGIPARLKTEAANRLFPVTVDGLGAIRVLVPSDRLDEARDVIENPAEIDTSDEAQENPA